MCTYIYIFMAVSDTSRILCLLVYHHALNVDAFNKLSHLTSERGPPALSTIVCKIADERCDTMRWMLIQLDKSVQVDEVTQQKFTWFLNLRVKVGRPLKLKHHISVESNTTLSFKVLHKRNALFHLFFNPIYRMSPLITLLHNNSRSLSGSEVQRRWTILILSVTLKKMVALKPIPHPTNFTVNKSKLLTFLALLIISGISSTKSIFFGENEIDVFAANSYVSRGTDLAKPNRINSVLLKRSKVSFWKGAFMKISFLMTFWKECGC
ncbi:hypothetical protein EGR_03084 [Echinococcus granulosus]|uniref:Uncharacterized protein n=1 Tax=Echinococcus granulosus TaxID=6210 RepID=W6ULY7_ECHGR|nr:hypothetical protein EGR_03084 [Echinococcus granulosus]EUB62063.1 hypothetical protein EGR_03084 [Echinococcus granulosus]